MFVCHQVVKYFDLERCRIKSGIKRALCKARQSPPFMIIAEVEKKQNKTTKYEVKHLIGLVSLVLVWDSLFYMG